MTWHWRGLRAGRAWNGDGRELGRICCLHEEVSGGETGDQLQVLATALGEPKSETAGAAMQPSRRGTTTAVIGATDVRAVK